MTAKMDIIELDKILLPFGRNLMSVAEGAELAADGNLAGKEKEEAIRQAVDKIKEYKKIVLLLESESKVRMEQFIEQHSFDMECIHESLDKLGIKY